MIHLLGLFLILIALKLVVSSSNSPIAMSINSLVDGLVAVDSSNGNGAASATLA